MSRVWLHPCGGGADHRAFASLWGSARAQRLGATPEWRHVLTLPPAWCLCPPLPERCATTGRTATASPTGRLPSVTGLASEGAQTAAPSGKQVSGDSASRGVGRAPEGQREARPSGALQAAQRTRQPSGGCTAGKPVGTWGPHRLRLLFPDPLSSFPDLCRDSLLCFAQRLRLPGFPAGASDQESACQCRRCRFDPWVRKIPWGRKWPPTPVFSPGESHGQRSLAGCSPRDHKESARTERLSTYCL